MHIIQSSNGILQANQDKPRVLSDSAKKNGGVLGERGDSDMKHSSSTRGMSRATPASNTSPGRGDAARAGRGAELVARAEVASSDRDTGGRRLVPGLPRRRMTRVAGRGARAHARRLAGAGANPVHRHVGLAYMGISRREQVDNDNRCVVAKCR
ncbi:hypothetical protein C8R44DRAFT_726687 [Mycena epipterygia]|nr:hypothetical protein C8R44DRAFT_726687 [Mycena epipterygia]